MAQLEPGTRVTMHLRVDSVNIVRSRKRYDGGEMNRMGECIVGDEFGCVKMMAYDSQLDAVKEGCVITIRNAHANVVKEHLRIEVDRWAKVEVAASSVKVGKVNLSKNASDIAYELVSVRL
jgi:ssDNA-binding replication factor A large subunit